LITGLWEIEEIEYEVWQNGKIYTRKEKSSKTEYTTSPVVSLRCKIKEE
jgi:hypothetical protein